MSSANSPVAARIAVSHVALNLFGGAYIAYFSPWLKATGFSPEAIGLLFAASNVLRVFTSPVAGIVADARNDRRSVMAVLVGLCMLFWTLVALSSTLSAIAVFAVLGAVCHAAIGPLLESVTIRQAAARGFDYGRVRMIGSLAFIGATILSGTLVEAFGLGVMMPLLLGAVLLTVLGAALLPPRVGDKIPVKPLAEALGATLRDAAALMRTRVFLVFLAASSLGQASHSFYYVFNTQVLEAQGYRGEAIGLLWGLGVLAEVVLFWYARAAFDRIGATNLLLIGALGCCLRWTVTAFSPPAPVFILVQLLHAASFGASHLGAMLFILKAVSGHLSSTAQSLYAIAAYGVVMAGASYLSGQLFAVAGAHGYLAMAVMGAGAAGLTLLLARLWTGGLVASEAHAPAAGGPHESDRPAGVWIGQSEADGAPARPAGSGPGARADQGGQPELP